MPGIDNKARNRARAHLASEMGRCRLRGTTRLPTIACMAQAAHVAPATMQAAVAEASAQGLLHVLHRTGIHLLAAGAAAQAAMKLTARPAPALSGRRRRQLCEAIEQDIASGRYGPGERLPSAKLLTEQHGVCHATLSRALQHLVDTDLLQRCRRGYRVAWQQAPTAGASVILVARGDQDGNLAVHSPRVEEHLRTLERYCAAAGLRLNVYTATSWNDTLYAPGPKALPRPAALLEHRPLGMLIWELGIGAAGLGRLAALADEAALPIAVLAENSEAMIPEALQKRSRTMVATTASDYDAGAQMGRYLRALGHRRIAFISPVHGALWSQLRLQGLTSVPGIGEHIETCLLARRGQHEFVSPTRHGTFREAQRMVRAIIGGGHLNLSYQPRAAPRALESALEHDAMGAALEGLLELLLERHRATAWIAASDSIALLCLDFLRRHQTAVPGHISVAGFDDGLDAFLNRLSSYNFNGSSALRAMLSFVLRAPSAWRGGSAHEAVSFRGFITGRSTTAAPRAAA